MILLKNRFKCYTILDILNVKSENIINSIEMFNSAGQMVYSSKNCNDKIDTIDIKSFEKGVYFIKLRSENETKNIKIIVD